MSVKECVFIWFVLWVNSFAAEESCRRSGDDRWLCPWVGSAFLSMIQVLIAMFIGCFVVH